MEAFRASDIKLGVPVVFIGAWLPSPAREALRVVYHYLLLCLDQAGSLVADENVGKGKIVIPSSPGFRDFYHLCKIFRR